jgi:hypothetical protein
LIKTDAMDIFQEYKDGLDYLTSMGFTAEWPENIRFCEGTQWPPATEKTKYMPRPVINQCDFLVENKQSNILSQSIKMVYSPQEQKEGEDLSTKAQDFTDAAANTWNDIDQESLNEDAVSDTIVLGTGVLHYYFDNSITGGQYTKYKGQLCGEIIDCKNIFFGNPHLKPSQTQKQPYIIIEKQEDTEQLKEIAKANKAENWENIESDEGSADHEYDSEKQKLTKAKKTTTLTKYFKKDGEVYWTKASKDVVIIKPTPLTPTTSTYKIKLYPIELLVFKPRRKCVYGRSMVKDTIPNQKALNFGVGMMLLSVQQTAWPKIISKVGALLQPITNEPGEILTDNTGMPGVDGIKYMQPPNFSQFPMLLTEKLVEMTRQVTGVTEVSSGEVIGANMAAAAIIALQNQAKKPNEAYQKKLFTSIKNIGRIWEEFYKSYYNMARPIEGKDEEGNEITKQFIGSDHADMSYGLKIDIGPASVFSESLQMTILDSYADRQWIDKYQHAKYAPSNILPTALKEDFEKEQKQILEMQQQNTIDVNAIMAQLTPEEQAVLQQRPELIDQVMGGGGGVSNMQGNVTQRQNPVQRR